LIAHFKRFDSSEEYIIKPKKNERSLLLLQNTHFYVSGKYPWIVTKVRSDGGEDVITVTEEGVKEVEKTSHRS